MRGVDGQARRRCGAGPQAVVTIKKKLGQAAECVPEVSAMLVTEIAGARCMGSCKRRLLCTLFGRLQT